MCVVLCLETIIGHYNTNNCYINDWLYLGEASQFTIMPLNGLSDGAFWVYTGGYLIGSGIYGNAAVRPVLYLSSNVEITSGDGSQFNPFRIKSS